MVEMHERGSDGESDDFDAFVRAQYPDLVRLGVLLLGDRSLAEDLAQTTLMKVYLRWRQIRAKDAASAYARRVLVRQAGRWRRRRWTGEQPTDPSSIPDGGVDMDVDNIVRVEAFQRALRSLPAAQRVVLVLRYFELRSEAEIAEILRIPAGTVKSRAARAIAALRAADVHIEDDASSEVEQPT